MRRPEGAPLMLKVLLRSDVDGVGRRGDIVEVAGGFARNFRPSLKDAPLVATEGVQAQAEAMRKSRDLREAKDKATAGAQAALLTGAVLRLEVRAGAAGRLFGSVSAADVAEAVKTHKGVEVNRHNVGLAEPIKAVGNSARCRSNSSATCRP